MLRMQSIGPTFRTFTLTALAILGYSNAAHAWGRIGHRVISRFAEQRLTEKTKSEINRLLEPRESLADASLWADEHRRQLPKTAPWHYVDVWWCSHRYGARIRRRRGRSRSGPPNHYWQLAKPTRTRGRMSGSGLGRSSVTRISRRTYRWFGSYVTFEYFHPFLHYPEALVEQSSDALDRILGRKLAQGAGVIALEGGVSRAASRRRFPLDMRGCPGGPRRPR